MRMVAGVLFPAGAITPGAGEVFGDPVHRAGIVVQRTEVPGFGMGGSFFVKPLREPEIPGQGFQYMLPGADGVGVADEDRPAFADGAEDVGDEAVFGPVAAADDVAGSGRGEGG